MGFAIRVGVRSYEVDGNGHVNHANYHRYGEIARMEHLTAAGITVDRATELGWGVVLLETHAKFLRELRHGDVVEIDSRLGFGAGKTFTVAHTLRKIVDDEPGEVAAEIECRLGLLDHDTRRLVADPKSRVVEAATDPGLLV